MEAKTNAEIEAFGTKHKDWKQFEPKMLEIAKQFQPAEGATTDGYLEVLYRLATYDVRVAEEAKQAIDRRSKSAASSEAREATVPAKKVSPGPSGPIELREAARMALRGEMVTQD